VRINYFFVRATTAHFFGAKQALVFLVRRTNNPDFPVTNKEMFMNIFISGDHHALSRRAGSGSKTCFSF
jgi:hypothetical protein